MFQHSNAGVYLRYWHSTCISFQGMPANASCLQRARTELAQRAMPNLGAVGCYLSPLHALIEARARGLPSVLILEDDAALQPGFETRLLHALASLPVR